MKNIEGVWLLVSEEHGPAGHGEPGDKYIALASMSGAHEIPSPCPAFLSEGEALAFAKKQDKWFLPRKAIFLPIWVERIRT